MCGRYQFSADEYKEIRQIVRDAQRRSEGNELNFPMAGDICPSQVAPVLVSRGEKIVGEFQQWGLPGFRGRQQIINARAETVTEKPMFRRSIAFQRCVIPATGFYEWDAAKHKYFFQMPGQPIYLAGICILLQPHHFVNNTVRAFDQPDQHKHIEDNFGQITPHHCGCLAA